MWTDTLEDRFAKPLGTKPTIDLTPRDIILCYSYYYVVKNPPNHTCPRPRTFVRKGFTVAPNWNDIDCLPSMAGGPLPAPPPGGPGGLSSNGIPLVIRLCVFL